MDGVKESELELNGDASDKLKKETEDLKKYTDDFWLDHVKDCLERKQPVKNNNNLIHKTDTQTVDNYAKDFNSHFENNERLIKRVTEIKTELEKIQQHITGFNENKTNIQKGLYGDILRE